MISSYIWYCFFSFLLPQQEFKYFHNSASSRVEASKESCYTFQNLLLRSIFKVYSFQFKEYPEDKGLSEILLCIERVEGNFK